jgi:hypothetical protein
MRQLLTVLFALSAGPLLANEPLEQVFSNSYPAALDGTLKIENTDGSIRIYGWNEPEIQVEAIKKAYTTERLKEIVIEVTPEAHGIAIKTTLGPKPGWFSFRDRSGLIDYTVMVPMKTKIEELVLANGEVLLEGLQGGSASATIGNGRITAHNCFSDLRLRVARGAIDGFYDWWEKNLFQLNFAIAHGNIRTVIPPDALVKVDAQTVEGNIDTDFDWQPEHADAPGKSLRAGTTTGAAPEMTLRTTSGSIKIETER